MARVVRGYPSLERRSVRRSVGLGLRWRFMQLRLAALRTRPPHAAVPADLWRWFTRAACELDLTGERFAPVFPSKVLDHRGLTRSSVSRSSCGSWVSCCADRDRMCVDEAAGPGLRAKAASCRWSLSAATG